MLYKSLLICILYVHLAVSYYTRISPGIYSPMRATVDEKIDKIQVKPLTEPLKNDVMIITNSRSLSYFRKKPSQEPVLWSEVFMKIAAKIVWEGSNNKYDRIEDGLKINVLSIERPESLVGVRADVLVLVGLSEADYPLAQDELMKLNEIVESASVVSVYNSSSSFTQLEKYGDYFPHSENPFEPFLLKFDEIVKSRRLLDRKRQSLAIDLWERKSLDDLVFMIFVLIDTYGSHRIKSVKSVTSTETTNFQQLSCMCSKCAKEIADCLKDETCRKALDCLNNCRGNDQVCSYRCITSHETPEFEKFAMCILQRNNCMGNSASIPVYPNPSPMETFRGRPLDFDTAENIFIGHLKLRAGEVNPVVEERGGVPLLPWSWKVVCGQNPAYDYFACQHQLFYRDHKRPDVVWYDPVFRVTTLYGEDVWRRRHYRVRRGDMPGRFLFSVVDNGVVSKEFWRILDCAEDLSWAVFYYGGAASAAGTSYTGALVVTPDGKWPEMTEETTSRIQSALAKGEITLWELFEVHNDCCDVEDNPPPLGIK